MKTLESRFNADAENEEGLNDIQEALVAAGLSEVEAPKVGSKAYDRLIDIAENYMAEVIKRERPLASTIKSAREGFSVLAARPEDRDHENYFSQKRSSSSSDTKQREYHNQLAVMLLGKLRTGMSMEDAIKISNFAAYLTGHGEYAGTFKGL